MNLNISELEDKTLTELQDIARTVGLAGYSRLKKNDLIFRLLRAKGLGILITDHAVRETLAIVDRAYILNRGRI